jgi:2-polyprenyl-3-methyl-5-hydroxy-6-metoxy-1,4-benzoquinol methylase
VAVRQDGLVIHECAACGLAYIDPRPSSEQLARYYSEGYFNGAKDFFQNKDYCLERDNGIRNKDVTGYREIVNHLDLSGKSVLDIGCASGALLYLMRECGAREVVGIDSAAYPIAFGVDNYGLDLRCTDLENAMLPDAHFDLITLIDVIEHVENLHSFLTELRRVLKPSGYLLIITPNYLSYFLARDQWTCLYKDFEHLQYFSEQSLREVFRSTGIRIMKSWTDSVPFRMFQYPRIYENGVHRLLHPRVATKNGIAEMRYQRALSRHHMAGASMNVILKAN